MEWSTQKPADPIEIRIYPGADGDFTLYEDENDNYNYVKGQHATIQFHWDDQTRTLNISARQGTFPGMMDKHRFNIVVVAEGNGIGIEGSCSYPRSRLLRKSSRGEAVGIASHALYSDDQIRRSFTSSIVDTSARGRPTTLK